MCIRDRRIIGLDPMRIDFIWTKLYRDLNWVGPFGASMCAISGIDMALLDLKGKALGVPVYDLLGGAYRTKILLYANYWFTNGAVSYTHLRAHETVLDLVCRLLLENKK